MRTCCAMPISNDHNLKNFQLILFAVMIFGFCFTQISDYDFWWHLSLGRNIFEGGFSDLTDKLSYTFSGTEQFRGEWLADLLLFLSVKMAGIAGANFVLFLTLSATFVFLYKTLEIDKSESGESRFYANLLTLILVLFAIRFRLFVRPYIFSYLFVSMFLYVLTRYRKERDVKILWLLPLIELVWANMSKGAFFGPIILVLFVVDHFFRHKDDRGPTVALLGVLLASLVSPEGYNLYWDLIKFSLQGSDGAAVGEHQPLTAQLLWGFGLKYTFGYQLLFLLSVVSFLFLRGWKNYFHLFLFLLFFLPSLFMIRMIDFFAIVSPLFIVPVMEKVRTTRVIKQLDKKIFALLFSSILVILIVVSTIGSHTYKLGIGVKENTFPEGSLEFIEKHNIRGRMFNSYPFGGYLTWFAPDRPVFIDGRINQLYPPDFYKEYKRMLHTPVAWEEAAQKWNFDYAIVEYDLRSFGQHFPKHLTTNPAWALVYWDNISAVYLKRTPANNPIIARFEYKVARPAFNDFSYVTQQMKLYKPAEILAQIDKEINFNGQNQEPRLLKASILFSMNKGGALNQQILSELDECLRLKPDLAMEHSAKALILINEKRMDEAMVEAKKASEIDPDDKAAKFVAEKLKLKP
jgi:hypothetical protein